MDVGKQRMTYLLALILINILVTHTVHASVSFTGANNAQSSTNMEKYREGVVLVKFNNKARFKNSSDVAKRMGVARADSLGMRGNDKSSRMWMLTLPNGQSVEAAIKGLSNNPFIEIVEPDYRVTASSIPNDTHFSDLWAMNNTGQTGGLLDADIDAVEGWSSGAGGYDVVVAVIDSGVKYTHEDLADNIWVNAGEIPGNGLDDDGNGYIDDVHGYDFYNNDSNPDDDRGHGTHVAGTIAAVANNNVGVAGVAWNSRIMALKFLNSGGAGYTSDAIKAINYARLNGAKIMNNSWGGTEYSYLLELAISDANSAGILFIAAAGNDTNDNDLVSFYPSSYTTQNIVSVAATDHNDDLASFSNYGLTSVDLAAPGVDILSSVPVGVCGFCTSDYIYADGTSMAAPHVAGAAAALWARFPNMTMAQVKDRLLNTVDPIPSLSGIMATGGRLNFHSALAMVDYKSVVSPQVQTINSGEGAVYILSFTSTSSEDQIFEVSLGTLSAGLSGSLSDSKISLPAMGSVDVTVTLSSTIDLARGFHPVKITITDSVSGEISEAEARLKVFSPGHELSVSPSSQTVVNGYGTTYSVTAVSIDGYSGPVDFSVQSPDPSITMSVSPSSGVLEEGGSISTTITVSTTSAAPIQSHSLAITATASGRTDTVNPELIVVEPGVCPSGCAYTSIQAAVNALVNGGTVYVGPGTYNERVFLSINEGIISAAGPDETIIDATGHAGSVVTVDGSFVKGFTIQGGTGEKGGGVDASEGGLIENSIIRNNSASLFGGGIYVNSTTHIIDSTIENNIAYQGGGIYADRYAYVNKNIIRGNSASSNGGGVYADSYSYLALRNNVITGNSASIGSGTYAISYSMPNFSQNTITGNSGSYAAYFYSYSRGSMSNSIVWGNGGGNIGVAMYGNVGLSYNLSSSDPLFVDAANGDYRLQAGSPAIDTGKNSGLGEDFDGNARPNDGDGLGAGTTGDGSDYDIGAFEYYEPVVNADVCPSGCPYSSIQAAIDGMGSGRITVGPGTYNETLRIEDTSIELISTNGPEVTIIDGSGLNQQLIKFNGTLIEGFTMQNADARSYGSGREGGAIHIWHSFHSKTIRNNIFKNNKAYRGGAIKVSARSTVIIDNVFENNTADSVGGAIYVTGSYTTNLAITKAIFKGNRAAAGGAIHFDQYTDGYVSNCLMHGNYGGRGGAIQSLSGTEIRINNCTIVNNTAWEYPGIYQPSNYTLPVYVGNSIFWNNRPTISSTTNNNVSLNYSLIGIDPLFVNESAADYQLQSGSPAIDTAANNGLTTDLIGNGRPFDGDGLGSGTTGDGSDYDMGAYEYQ